MNRRDPKLTVLMFNECINARDLEELVALMTDDHAFIDRDNDRHEGKDHMSRGWRTFFDEFPDYRNTFLRVQSAEDLVVVLGYVEWAVGGERDHVIWTATIRDDLVAEWRVLEDTEANREPLGLR
ncbi:nuclear transport factor 2 family protein [bacterium]|nr:nuclear transport factor 2 family protein [bacterium]